MLHVLGKVLWVCLKSIMGVFGFMEVGGKLEVGKLISYFPCLF